MTLYPNEYVSLEQPHNNYWNHKQKVQWMLMLFSGCLYLYAARMAMPITVTVISGQTGWNKTTAGVVLCCFFWGYALTQVLGGYLGDLWGGAKVVLGSALGWSLLTLYTPEATRWNLATLLVARILLGAFQGLHFPAMSSIIVNHLRPQERTFFTSVVAAGPSCGLLLIGSVGSMAMVSHGWPVVFKLTGMLGIGWCFGLAYLMHRHGSKPGKASKVAPKVASAPAFRVPWIAYFRSPSFWVILLAHFTENNSYFILISWLPTYFHERFPEAQMWVFNMVPWIITPICSIGGGTLADYLIKRGHPVSRVRKLLEMACQLSKAALLPLVPWCSYAGALTCVTLAVASSGFHNSGVFINPQDIAPLHAGSVFGLMNTVGAIPGVVGVYLVGYVVDATRSWALIFHTTALLNVLGCGFFLAFGRGHPVLS
ncbi:LOW QUALITY PROTEIN: solute carrier family 17 member 9 [Ixodes scapularis]|uniref:LOW QUALITY PROTEIN: solute carrier family 17 member 9 n=1 Tax=Ixodes scapularis TaxID=6945 RepID=UPI001C383CB2|nr:LOW QUALITY PROTEIN: solute carrier family 17 member 9 [Ixodes scapularis]